MQNDRRRFFPGGLFFSFGSNYLTVFVPWRTIFESGNKFPEPFFFPGGAILEQGKNYRKVVAQSL